jgi:hypothetical protein
MQSGCDGLMDLAGDVAFEFPESSSGGETLLGAVLGGVVDRLVMPARPDDPEPGPGQDANGVGMVLAASAGVGVELGGPRRAVPRVAGEGGQGLSGLGVGRPAEGDGPALAGGFGDRRGPAFGGGVLDGAGAVQDWADLGDDLGQVDLADAGQVGQQLGLGVAEQPGAQRVVQVGDRGQQGAQQPDLGADELGEHLGSEPDRGRWGGAEPLEELGRAAPPR